MGLRPTQRNDKMNRAFAYHGALGKLGVTPRPMDKAIRVRNSPGQPQILSGATCRSCLKHPLKRSSGNHRALPRHSPRAGPVSAGDAGAGKALHQALAAADGRANIPAWELADLHRRLSAAAVH